MLPLVSRDGAARAPLLLHITLVLKYKVRLGVDMHTPTVLIFTDGVISVLAMHSFCWKGRFPGAAAQPWLFSNSTAVYSSLRPPIFFVFVF